MLSNFWHTVFFDPVYNTLVFFIDAVPGGDVGIAIVLTTVLVKVVLLPLSIKAAKTQKVMRELEPKLKEIKETHKDDRQAQAQAMMAAYKEGGINPFASLLLVFIQIPIIIALYLSVVNGGGAPLPEINTDLLYSFVPAPEMVDMIFLGYFDIAGRSILLAFLAAAAQFAHTRIAMPAPEPKKEGEAPSFKDDFARSMQFQMRYVMPIIIFIVAYTISAAIALYFLVSNLAQIAQEYYVRRHR